MTAQLVLKSKDIIIDYPLPKQSLKNGVDPCKPSKPSNSSMTSTVTIIDSNQNNKNVKNTKPHLLNENDGKIKSIKKREEMNTKKNMKQNHAKNDPIKVQNEFYGAMNDAIHRFLEKNPESNKISAEESVFVALGYDASIEYQQEREKNEDEDEDIDIDIGHKTKHSQSFLDEIKHYRIHHIMRDHDAIRTFRIKQLQTVIMQQHPTFQLLDVPTYLTRKLNELYLPSPSPPPPIIEQENKENVSNQHESDTDKSKINKNNKNKTNLSKNARNNVKLSDIVQTKNCNKICKDKSINVTINQSNNNDKKVAINSNNNNEKNQVISCNVINNGKSKKNHPQQSCDKSNNNNDKHDHNDDNDRNSSPSQIYITVNDDSNDPFRNNVSSHSTLKYKELSNPSSMNSSGIGFQSNSSSTCSSYISSTSSLPPSSSPFIGHYQTNNTSFINDKLSKQSKFFVSTFNNEDDEVLQKMALHKTLHKKSRKRKSEMNSFENGQISQIVQPPKKRVRYSGNNKRSKKLRNKNNKSRGRGRGTDRKSNRNPYGNQQSLRRSNNVNDNRSTDCFDDEEDDASDIDLNPNNTNNLLRPQAQHL